MLAVMGIGILLIFMQGYSYKEKVRRSGSRLVSCGSFNLVQESVI